MIRVSLTFNTGPQAGKVLAAAAVRPDAEALLQLATNKFRLKRREAERARLFVWGRGAELPRAGDVRALITNGETIAVSLGEAYAGSLGRVGAAPADEPAGAPDAEARWSAPRPALAIIEWADAAQMNGALGRMSTLLEHPVHCALESTGLVSVAAQRALPSSSYVGHNLYDTTFAEFERRADMESAAIAAHDSAAGATSVETALRAVANVAAHDGPAATARAAAGPTAAEARFLARWRDAGCPPVVISYVRGAERTLQHELCHARYALEPTYRDAANALWAEHAGRLRGWMRDLGYHHSRHADEFGAYVLTEPASFWRGRLDAADVRRARSLFPAAVGLGDGHEDGHGAGGCDCEGEAAGKSA